MDVRKRDVKASIVLTATVLSICLGGKNRTVSPGINAGTGGV